MSTTKYLNFFSKETKQKLSTIIGYNIIQFKSINSTINDLSIDENSVLHLALNTKVYFSLKKGSQFSEWQINGIPLGDIWIGYDSSAINIEPINLSIDSENWIKKEQNQLHKPDSNNLNFRPQGKITGIDIYGFYKKFIRNEDEEKFKIEANVDMLLVLNTAHKSKIVIAGQREGEGISISVYPSSALYLFDEWLNSKENQWDEKIYRFKESIQETDFSPPNGTNF